MTVALLVKVPINPEKFDEACEAMASVGSAVRKEDGCVNYDFYSVEGDRTAIWGVEVWRDEAALKAHGQQPHMAPFREKLMPTLSGAIEMKPLTLING